jgi:hypothetical protein
MSKIDDLKELLNLLKDSDSEEKTLQQSPIVGLRCLVRTYSAGVHIGTVEWVNPNNAMECKLKDSLRLWKWEGGGLSLSAVANNGIKGGRLNKTGDVYLTNSIEYIPTTPEAEETYARFIED